MLVHSLHPHHLAVGVVLDAVAVAAPAGVAVGDHAVVAAAPAVHLAQPLTHYLC